MNRIEFAIFIRKQHNARYVTSPGDTGEWRFRNGEHHYTIDTEFEENRSTYEPHLTRVKLCEWMIGNAADDVPRHRVKYEFVDDLQSDRITREELRAWLVKTIVTWEFR